jgi:hypothetical protein
MKFNYKKIYKGIIRPIIPIQLEFQGRKIWYEVLVDSGADNCIFDAEIADIFGIDVESGLKAHVVGITGKPEPYFIHRLQLSVGDASFPLYAGFKRGFPKFGYGVVGQKGFFEHFMVQFDYQQETIELMPKQWK